MDLKNQPIRITYSYLLINDIKQVKIYSIVLSSLIH